MAELGFYKLALGFILRSEPALKLSDKITGFIKSNTNIQYFLVKLFITTYSTTVISPKTIFISS